MSDFDFDLDCLAVDELLVLLSGIGEELQRRIEHNYANSEYWKGQAQGLLTRHLDTTVELVGEHLRRMGPRAPD